ncbi:MAG: VanZ family protein [Gammaproteobacteria bacterium]|nr:VanZ family protein [Gammaproteobacteria bacterium]
MTRNALRAIWLAIGWVMVVVIWIISLIPLRDIPALDFEFSDKLEHMVAYLILMTWFGVAYANSRWLRVAGWLTLMGIGIEIAQRQTGYRMFDLLDIVADLLGIAAAWAVLPLITRHNRSLAP